MLSNRFFPSFSLPLTSAALATALALAGCGQQQAEAPAEAVDTTAQTEAQAQSAQPSASEVAAYNQDEQEMAEQALWMELKADDGSAILVAFREDEDSGNRYLDIKLDGKADSPPVTLGAVAQDAYGDGDELTAVVSEDGGKVELVRKGGAKKTYN